MYYYKLIIAYDGTDYYGWQWQNTYITIEQVMRKVFCGVFKQKKIELVAASRTDRGVHAHGQVIRLGTLLELKPELLLYVLSRALPTSISIISCDKISSKKNFHPQHNIIKKTYIYRFYTIKPLPEYARYAYVITRPFSLARFKEALACFVGEHDFVAFSKEEKDKNTIRTIQSITVESCLQTQMHSVVVQGSSFLRHMIRRIVGAAFEYAIHNTCQLEDILYALKTGNMKKNLPVAPAKGLCLKAIDYKKTL